jgi:uncharacterized protein YcaQ
MSVPSLTWAEVWRQRLRAHRLDGPAPRRDLTKVVGAVCGIHAQVMASAELSIGLRVDGVSRTTVRDALWKRKTLVKTYGLRGTIHVVPSRELGLWLAALRATPKPNQTSRLEWMRLTPRQIDRVVHAIADALDGQRLTGQQLEAEVARRVGSWALEPSGDAFASSWTRVRMCIGSAAGEGVLCFGPNEGSRVTYVRPDQWLGPIQDMDGEEALREVVRRYLRAYGPSTHRDLAPWLLTTATGARGLLRSLGDELEEVDVEGDRSWRLADDGGTADGRQSRTNVRLLPEFDCYLVGCRPRDRLVPAAVQRAGAKRGLHRVHFHSPIAILLVDGVVAGIWQRRAERGRVTLTAEPFERLTSRQRSLLRQEADRIGGVLETPVSLDVGPVRARPYFGTG